MGCGLLYKVNTDILLYGLYSDDACFGDPVYLIRNLKYKGRKRKGD